MTLVVSVAREGAAEVPSHPLPGSCRYVMPALSVILPADNERRRESLLARVAEHIESVLPDAEIIISRGSVDPYNKAQVCNRGARDAGGDVLVFVDADMIHHPNVLRRAAAVSVWGVPRSEVRNLLPGEAPGGGYSVRPGLILGRGGLFAFAREAFDSVGNFDEGFVGWGCEDEALYTVATEVLGSPEDLGDEPAYHLHHEHQPERPEVRRNPHCPNRKRLAEIKQGGCMRIKVENTSKATIARGAMVFPASETKVVEVDDYRLKEIRSCRQLSVTVIEGGMIDEDEDDTSDVKPMLEPNPFMEPPIHLCGCGFVAKSAAGLKAHQRTCR